MSTSTALQTQTYTDTPGGRMLREIDEAAHRSMQRVLSSEVITEGQRAVAWVAFHAATMTEKMLMSAKLGKYVSEVLSGKRQARPDVVAQPITQPVVTPEVAAEDAPVVVEVQAEVVAPVVAQPEPVAVEVQAEVAPLVVAEVAVQSVADVVATEPEEAAEFEVVSSEVVPMWVATTERAALPDGLVWSGAVLPAAGTSVEVVRRGRARVAKVVGYFHAEGFLGVMAEFEGRVPSQLRTAPRSNCFFGSDLRVAA